MRLRRKPRRAPEEKTAAEGPEFDDPSEEYIGVTETLLPGGGEEVWAADPASGRFQALPAVLAAILQHAGRFRTLAGHRQALLQAGWQYDGSGYLEGAFRGLIERGLLRAKSELLAAAAAAAPTEAAPPPITSVAWVTRDRRESLLRGVESFAANVREHNREAELAVYDDSADADERRLTREALARLGRDLGTQVRYAGQEEKREFARAILEAGRPEGLPLAVVEFALFDPFALGHTIGANTNALLLDTVGRAVLLLNDDLVGRFAGPPWGDLQGLALSSAVDPTAKLLFPDRASLEAAAQGREVDLLGTHQSLLGRSPGACIHDQADPREIDCADTGAGFMRSLEDPRARVRVTMAGFYGDSGMGYPVFALFADGETRERLLASEEHYRSAVCSRQLLRAVPASTISDSPFLMAANCGLDNRELLPPFLPVMHSCDGVFAQVLRTCLPSALIGHLPLATAHFPPEQRQFADGQALRAGPPRLADLLILLARRFAPQVSRLGEEGLRSLGQTLMAVSRMKAADFQALARATWAAEMSAHLASLETLLVAHDGQPEFWAQDVARRIEAVGREVTSQGAFAPSDLGGAAERGDAAALGQGLIGSFGELLYWWTVLGTAAASCRSAGGGSRPL